MCFSPRKLRHVSYSQYHVSLSIDRVYKKKQFQLQLQEHESSNKTPAFPTVPTLI